MPGAGRGSSPWVRSAAVALLLFLLGGGVWWGDFIARRRGERPGRLERLRAARLAAAVRNATGCRRTVLPRASRE